MLSRVKELDRKELNKLWLPDIGDKYFIPNMVNESGYSSIIWDGFNVEMEVWRRGLVFQTRVEAVAKCKELKKKYNNWLIGGKQ